ncbi:MAG: helix-turn-helix transcriptional regulator, partial [Oscillospiraceae bacterium]|nr:helix-turn-helix transcriptional regulator [Oscillospiraceae bacterium]
GIEEIAFMCGYKSPVHFSRQFKQINDSSPKEWRIMNNES